MRSRELTRWLLSLAILVVLIDDSFSPGLTAEQEPSGGSSTHTLSNIRPEPQCGQNAARKGLSVDLRISPIEIDRSDYYSEVYLNTLFSWHHVLADELRRGYRNLNKKDAKSISVLACTRIRFTITRTGKLGETIVIDSTGSSLWPNTPLLAVQRLALSKLPDGFAQDHIEVIETFTINVDDVATFRTQMLADREHNRF
jgi:hypothetical protein